MLAEEASKAGIGLADEVIRLIHALPHERTELELCTVAATLELEVLPPLTLCPEATQLLAIADRWHFVGKRLFNIIQLGHTGQDQAIQLAARLRREEQFRGLTEELAKAAERCEIDSTPYHNLLGNLDNSDDAAWDATFSLTRRLETILENEWKQAAGGRHEPSEPTQPYAATEKAEDPSQTGPDRVSTDALFIQLIATNPDARGWAARKVAKKIGRSKSAVADTNTWKELSSLRGTMRIDKQKDRHRRSDEIAAERRRTEAMSDR